VHQVGNQYIVTSSDSVHFLPARCFSPLYTVLYFQTNVHCTDRMVTVLK